MEEITTTTTQEPIYFPDLKRPNYFKILAIIAGALLLLWVVLSIFTKKDKLHQSDYIKNQIDSLQKANIQLQKKQQAIDSTTKIYEGEIIKLDWKLQNVGHDKTIIREYYRDKVKQPANYTPKQVDSFFKKRYNY